MARILTEGFELAGVHSQINFWHQERVQQYRPYTDGHSFVLGEFRDDFLASFTPSNEVFLRVWFYANNQAYFSDGYNPFRFRNASNVELASLFIREGYPIQFLRGNTTVATASSEVLPTRTSWHMLEWRYKCDNVAGISQVKLDGVLILDFAGNTNPTSATTITQLYVRSGFNNQWHDVRIDDLAINNTDGSEDNSWIGDSHISLLLPKGNGSHSDFMGSDGNQVDNYLLVDEYPAPDGDTTYVESDTPGATDLYSTSGYTIPDGSEIRRVWVAASVKSMVAEADTLKLVLKSGAAEVESQPVTLTTNYTLHLSDGQTLNPDGNVAWTPAAVNALQFGVRVP